MNAPLRLVAAAAIAWSSMGPACLAQESEAPAKTVTFESLDGVTITADLYRADADPKTPMIVLCHQAGWSRGEYREIAPRLNRLGFNCLALDQRSGGQVNEVPNQTAVAAERANQPTGFVDAEQDIRAALRWVRPEQAQGPVLLWGSSYSAALALRIAGEHPDLVDGVLAFSPGEYFTRFGQPQDWIRRSAAKIECPVFITSALGEANRWQPIYASISSEKQKFVPETNGNHGSRALWSEFDDSGAYWQAVESFLSPFQKKRP